MTGNSNRYKERFQLAEAATPMKLSLRIEPDDIERLRTFLVARQGDAFVRRRIAKNLGTAKPRITKRAFWERMVACLLTTQQRSGPKSAVTRFITTRPFPLRYRLCLANQNRLLVFTRQVITDFGGLRRGNQIAAGVTANLNMLEAGGWKEMFQVLGGLKDEATPETERTVANFIDDRLVGFGPKQSRNLLQSLGLTRYEIPIDSRITKWLTDFGFPMKLSAGALADQGYFEFVMDAVQQLCKEADVFPCALDAAVFSSFDDGGWSEKNMVW